VFLALFCAVNLLFSVFATLIGFLGAKVGIPDRFSESIPAPLYFVILYWLLYLGWSGDAGQTIAVVVASFVGFVASVLLLANRDTEGEE
jgi:hypothetical protein